MVLNRHTKSHTVHQLFLLPGGDNHSHSIGGGVTFLSHYTISRYMFFQQNFYDYSSWNVCVLLRLFSIMFCYCFDFSGVDRLFQRMLANILMTMLSILGKVLFCVCDSGAEKAVQKQATIKKFRSFNTRLNIITNTQSESLNGIANTKYSPLFCSGLTNEVRKEKKVAALRMFWEIFIL